VIAQGKQKGIGKNNWDIGAFIFYVSWVWISNFFLLVYLIRVMIMMIMEKGMNEYYTF
jgi:hypothetical protein